MMVHLHVYPTRISDSAAGHLQHDHINGYADGLLVWSFPQQDCSAGAPKRKEEGKARKAKYLRGGTSFFKSVQASRQTGCGKIYGNDIRYTKSRAGINPCRNRIAEAAKNQVCEEQKTKNPFLFVDMSHVKP